MFDDRNRPHNRLIDEKSPYLLQHAHNPVDWFPWGDEAFEKARLEDKPIFLSIGYSTCHWCHVMERESFEDEEVAELLNKSYVCIKVDREERPDVDAFYMDACMVLTGSGGWPLSCFLAYDKKPFFAGTYFPKNDGMYGTGFLTLLAQIDEIWRTRRNEIAKSAHSITLRLEQKAGGASLKPDRPGSAFHQLKERFDRQYGGFGGAPKFPSLQNLMFLMRYGLEYGEPQAFEMVRKTLDFMYEGGIYDHIGGGFCRYSTDAGWQIPHFEKMMTDNALHIMVYSEAAALFGGRYAAVARDVTRFCMRDMLDTAGGFYTATDADSEGVEGKYYSFAPDEIKGILGEEDGWRYCELYHITQKGNFDGKNVPHLTGSAVSGDDAVFAARCNDQILLYRSRRVPPFRDDKVLTLVNGLMAAALAAEGRILQDRECIETARRCVAFTLSTLVKDGRLLSRWRGGEAGIPASCDDYACLIWGLLELYEATFAPEWLKHAIQLTGQMNELFLDRQNGGYFLAGSDVDDLPVRQKSCYDGAMPCGNSMMALNLIRLSRLCGNENFEEIANQIIRMTAPMLNSQPTACCGLLCSLLYLKNGGTEITLASGEGFDVLKTGLPVFSPFLTVAACGKGFEKILPIAPYFQNYHPADGKAAAYVCRNGSCQKPVTSAEALAKIGFVKTEEHSSQI